MTLFRLLRAGAILHMRPNTLSINVPRRCYVQAYIVQYSQLSRRKFLTLKHLRRFSTDALKTKVAISAKQVTKAQGSKNKELRKLFRLAAPEKWRLAGAIAFLVISSTVTMAVPFCLGKVIDIIYAKDHEQTRQNLQSICLILLGVFIFGGLCNFFRVYLMSTTAYKITQSLRRKAYTAILSQETAMFDKVSTGELVGRLSGNFHQLIFSKLGNTAKKYSSFKKYLILRRRAARELRNNE